MTVAASVAACALGIALPALAQPPATAPEDAPPPAAAKSGPRFFISGDGGYQVSSSGFTSQVTFPLYAESLTFTTTAPDAGGANLAMRAGFRLFRSVAIGAGVTGFWSTRSADVTASLPHPFYFGRPRSGEGSASDLKRDETMVAIEASWIVRLGPRVELQLFGGPAFFSVKADMPTNVRFTESYPYDTASVTGVETRNASDSAAGFTVGADIAYMFNPSIGVGGHVRFSRASASLASGTGSTTVDLGGVQTGGGIRFRF